ncbi:MAG: DUF192 domain-containing protein [Gammaproteobacteria bacterium]|nr:DUF192 domain-containing protein [Gammaproteobacteria bacterium]
MNSRAIPLNVIVILLTLCEGGIFPCLQASDQVLFESASLDINGRQFELEIAKTAIHRQHGLMYREFLSERSGMLFIYPEAGFHRIWMKNTLIPLTVVWFDIHQTVIHIDRLDPCQLSHCPSFGADSPSKYIIELTAGNQSLRIGDRIPMLANFLAKE